MSKAHIEKATVATTQFAENSLSENVDELNVRVEVDTDDDSELNVRSVDVSVRVSISSENLAIYSEDELDNIPQLEESFESHISNVHGKAKTKGNVTQAKAETSNLTKAQQHLDAELLRFPFSIDDIKHDNDESSDDDDSYEIDVESENQRLHSQSSDFFTTFGKIPVVSEISLSILDEARRAPSIYADKSEFEIDQGVFVHPLTGQLLQSTSEESICLGTDEEVQDEATHDKDEDVELSSFLSAKSLKRATDVTDRADDHADIAILFKMKSLLEKREDDGSGDLTQAEAQHELNIKHSTTRFLYGLIDKAVRTFEQIDFKVHLTKSLDKNVMVLKLLLLLTHLDVERRSNAFLNTKLTDYYRRKKNYRPITPDDKKQLSKYYVAFLAAINRLDFTLGKELVTKQMHQRLIEIDLQKLAKAESMVRTSEDELESTIHNMLLTAKSTAGWKAYVARVVRKMADKRDEVSTVRLKIIKRQHSLAELKDKIERLEFIGPAITLTMFERTTSKVTKLLEMTAEVDGSIDRIGKEYNNVLHFLAHIRENRYMLSIDSIDNHILYDEMRDNYSVLRERLHSAKVKHGALSLEAKNINYEVGLLDKPILLFDYDATVEMERKLRKVYMDLNKQHMGLLKRRTIRHLVFK